MADDSSTSLSKADVPSGAVGHHSKLCRGRNPASTIATPGATAATEPVASQHAALEDAFG